MLLAGFGNLNGNIDIWDSIKREKTGSCKQHATTSCLWSPCNRKFMTATLHRRLKVDNKMVVYDYTGKQVSKVLLKDGEE